MRKKVMGLALSICVFIASASAQEVQSVGPNAGFRVGSGPGDDVNQAPWYGLGLSNVSLWPGQNNAVQVAGFFGLNFQTGYGQMVMRGDNGNIGVGTTNPTQKFEVDNGNILLWTNNYSYPVSAGTYYGSKISFSQWSNAGSQGSAEIGSIAKTAWSHGWLPSSGLYFSTSQQDSSPAVRMVLDNNGNLGIGTTAPGFKLEVNGSVALTTGSGASITYADGTVQSTAWNGTTLGGDYAESIDVLGDRAEYEPGDVIIINAASPGRFEKSNKAYSKLVAGVYSTKPGLVGRRSTFQRVNKAAEVPMAILGIVPTKVTTENGQIESGDLLVSSRKPGYAMKGTDKNRLTGAVLGKALAPLSSGDGVIEVMISIQ